MPSTGTGMAPAAAPKTIESPQPNILETAVAPQVREAAQWFFWVVAATIVDSLFLILGSHVHRFTGLGMADLVDGFSDGRIMPHVIINCWAGMALMFLGFFATEGQKGAFVIGIALFALDVALLCASQNYLSIPFHAFVLYMLYRGYAALKQSAVAEGISR
jgi:hypothetical protein